MSEQKKSRKGLVARSTVAAGVATAVLLGGFGAFSLWNDALPAGTGSDIATGTLAFDGVTPGTWKLVESDGVIPAGSEIDPAEFKASPGDVLQYTADVNVIAEGSDMLAQLTVDPDTYSIAPALADGVTVELDSGAYSGTIPIEAKAGSQEIPVTVTVSFSPTISGTTGQNLASAVSLSGLDFRLDQVTA